MATNLDASIFVKNNAIKASRKLFIDILRYIIFCYFQLLREKVTYSEKYVADKTSHHLEDYLKFRLVEDYLQKLKNEFDKNRIRKIHFQCETQKEYVEDNKIAIDKIDIFVSNLSLQKYWSTSEESIYFAIECKRLKNTSKNPPYIEDIKKFTGREYNFRIPISGMIAFVEKSSLSFNDIVSDINKKLDSDSDIATNDTLKLFPIDDKFHFSFRSNHSRTPSGTIELFHLLFDYSLIIKE